MEEKEEIGRGRRLKGGVCVYGAQLLEGERYTTVRWMMAETSLPVSYLIAADDAKLFTKLFQVIFNETVELL